MHRYTARWPVDSQRFVRRGEFEDFLKVVVSSGLNPYLMPEEEFDNSFCRGSLESEAFFTDGEGYSLLLYETGPAGKRNWVGFQAVHSVVRTDVSDMIHTNWTIGIEITNSAHQGPKTAYMYEPTGDRYEPILYGERDYKGWTTGHIFAVNRGLLEVWWCNLSHTNVSAVSNGRRRSRSTRTFGPLMPNRLIIAERERVRTYRWFTLWRLGVVLPE